MKVLVANLGSTSFKYRLFDMQDESQLARGGIERIGSAESQCFVEIGENRQEVSAVVPDHAEAVRMCLEQLTDAETGCLSSGSEVAAIGFKAVHGGTYSGVQRINEDVLNAMSAMNEVAPAHNPPYIAAMRNLAEQLPEIALVAAFETGFHETIDPAWHSYGIPWEWAEQHGVRKWGFHGASHRYIAQRTSELFPNESLRVISFHLGGSSSMCAIRDGRSVATTMGMSPQTGLPHNNRVGDFDPFAIPVVMKATGLSLEGVLDQLATQSGLLGMSGVSGDLRDLESEAAAGNGRAKLAMDMFVAEIRRCLGGLMVALQGIDMLVFTGGIGENGAGIRAAVCEGLDYFGIELNSETNAQTRGREARLDSANQSVQIWTIPTNEELIVARQTASLLKG